MYWVCELSEECRVSVDIVAFVSLNSCSRQRVCALFIFYKVFIPCSPSLYLDVRLIRLRCSAVL